MKSRYLILIPALLVFLGACTSQKKLAYLGSAPPTGGSENFPMEVAEYRLKPRDVLYITIKAMGPEGKIEDYLGGGQGGSTMLNSSMQGDGMGLYGYDISSTGSITLPAIGDIKVEGMTIPEARNVIEDKAETVFLNSTVQVKLLSFKYTIIGEVKMPGTFTNYSNYLTILEALGRAGGLTDVGNRDKVTVVRPYDGGTKTFRVNLGDNSIFASEVYTLQPNDVIIVEPYRQKTLALNLPILTSILTTLSTIILIFKVF